jgi:hypothetical protein
LEYPRLPLRHPRCHAQSLINWAVAALLWGDALRDDRPGCERQVWGEVRRFCDYLRPGLLLIRPPEPALQGSPPEASDSGFPGPAGALDRICDGVRSRGAAVAYLSHDVSFLSFERIKP